MFRLRRSLLLLLPAAMLILVATGCDEAKQTVEPDDTPEPGLYRVNIDVGGLERDFQLIIPPSYDPARNHPLLLCYHGGNLSAGFMVNNRQDLIRRCEQENWILVFTNGYEPLPGVGRTWNAVHCCPPAHRFGIDDMAYTRRIIDTVTAALRIDGTRIYAMGGSNGGMFTHRLAAEMSDVFAAVAPNQGTIGGRADSLSPLITVQPTLPMPIMLIHGLDDRKVNYFGGKTAEGERIDVSFGESVRFWAAHNQCEMSAGDTVVTTGQNGRVWIVSYRNCNENAEVRAVTIENKGHGWPSLEEAGWDGTNASIDFLKQFSRR